MQSKYLKHKGMLYIKAEEGSLTQQLLKVVDYDDGIAFDVVKDAKAEGLDLVKEVEDVYSEWVIESVNAVKHSYRKVPYPGHDRVTAAFIATAVKEALKEVDWTAIAERAQRLAKRVTEDNESGFKVED